MRRGLGILLMAAPAAWAAPQWKPPKELRFGQVETLLLVDDDPAAKPLLRPPVDAKLGPLHVRSLEPTEDGRGWRFQVQAFAPGAAVVSPLDLGDGRWTPELRIAVPRTAPYGAPWVGVGGGREDQLPLLPFPIFWAAVAVSPLLAFAAAAGMLWRRAAPRRRQRHARRVFQKVWPPGSERASLDQAHAAGRALLAAHCGDEAMAWGAEDLQARGFNPWCQWVMSLDAARFGGANPPFPPVDALLANLEARSRDILALRASRAGARL